MANADRPQGFRVKGKLRRVTEYTAGAECFPGDAVKLSADGKVDPAAAGDALLGVALCYASADGQTVQVADDPDQLFVGQADGSDFDAQDDIGNVAEILATAGDSTYRCSRMEIDSSSLTAAGSAQMQVLGVDGDIGNSLGAQVDLICRINEHQLKEGSSGV